MERRGRVKRERKDESERKKKNFKNFKIKITEKLNFTAHYVSKKVSKSTFLSKI